MLLLFIQERIKKTLRAINGNRLPILQTIKQGSIYTGYCRDFQSASQNSCVCCWAANDCTYTQNSTGIQTGGIRRSKIVSNKHSWYFGGDWICRRIIGCNKLLLCGEKVQGASDGIAYIGGT